MLIDIINVGLTARHNYVLGTNYIIDNVFGIVPIEESTSAPMYGQQLVEGLHDALRLENGLVAQGRTATVSKRSVIFRF